MRLSKYYRNTFVPEFLRTDAGTSLGIDGLALSSILVGWLDRMNCGVCP